MVVCSYAVWQYREECNAEGSRSVLLKNTVMVVVGNVFLVRPS